MQAVLQCHDTDRDQFPSLSFINTPQLSACAERWAKFPTFGVLHVFVANLWGPAHICSVALENGRNVFPQTKGHSRGGGRV